MGFVGVVGGVHCVGVVMGVVGGVHGEEVVMGVGVEYMVWEW